MKHLCMRSDSTSSAHHFVMSSVPRNFVQMLWQLQVQRYIKQ
jgi:hypothetical protein